MSSYAHQGPPASNASHSYGPPTANDHLRESMHGSINWKERQMFNSYADPGPDIVERRWPFLWSFLAAMAASAALWLAIIWALGWLSVANAAEADRPHDLWLLAKPVEDRPSIFKIAAGYPSRSDCENAKKRVRLKVQATLQCHSGE